MKRAPRYHAPLPFAARKAFVARVGALVSREARRRRCRWIEARERLQERLGLTLRGWQDLSSGRVERVPGVVLVRLEAVEAGT